MKAAATAPVRARGVRLAALPLVGSVKRRRAGALAGLVVASAVWGMVVDGSLIPVPALTPTGNSTLFQATTAAAFALLGILYGPWVGASGGLVRDGTGYLALLLIHPAMVLHPGFSARAGHAIADIIEDMLLGWIPALVAQHTRRLDLLALATAGAAWISLPLLVAGTVLSAGHPGHLWSALTTAVGDWNEPVDPGLTVYALLAAALVTLALARWTSRPRIALLMAVAFAAPAALLIALGAHP
ncbi:MAG TPA: hypothetical protein VJQ45_01745 [Ktedonobacterales bacterium]|nr:hypothetical protein [Ktedonobacterales bacterium]